MVQLRTFVNHRGTELHCRLCRAPLLLCEVVSTTTLRRHTIAICGNFCDRICPICGGECEFINDGDEKLGPHDRGTIECDDCGWEGKTPNPAFAAQLRKREHQEHLTFLVESGVNCPVHREISLVSERRRVPSNLGTRLRLEEFKVCSKCGPVGEAITIAEFKVPSADWAHPSACQSCEQLIRGDGLCGCS